MSFKLKQPIHVVDTQAVRCLPHVKNWAKTVKAKQSFNIFLIKIIWKFIKNILSLHVNTVLIFQIANRLKDSVEHS